MAVTIDIDMPKNCFKCDRRRIMSSDKYIRIAETMNEKQKNIMWNLFMSGKNFDDGHSWVTFQEAEDAVAGILMAERGITE